jgi:hypothetical protein
MFGLSIFNSASLKKIQADKTYVMAVLDDAKDFILQIEKGNHEIQITGNLQKHEIGSALQLMQASLKRIANEEYERNWITKGLANFVEILRDTSDIKTFSDRVISHLVKYLEFNQGALYIENKDEAGNTFLQLYGSYAYNKKKYREQKIMPGEGLIGTCYLEKSVTYMTNVPHDYVSITSGLGEASPRNIFISPLVINDVIYGVIELASFNLLKVYQRTFIEKISESIASSISNVKAYGHTHQLLTTAQLQSEILATQEEEMRQNMEEMAATQEELHRRNQELQAKELELKQIMAEMTANEEDIQKTQESHRKLMKEYLLLKKEFAAVTKSNGTNDNLTI